MILFVMGVLYYATNTHVEFFNFFGLYTAGMNIARALGDKFLKEQDGCFSSQPFVSEAIRIDPESRVLAVMAR